MNPHRQPAAAARSLRDLLRRPAVIVSELVAIGASAAVAATFPQEPEADQIRRFAEESPQLARIAAALGLHRIVQSPWFLAFVGLAMLSLAVVQVDQWRRLHRLWRAPLEPASFARAAFRRQIPLAETRAPPSFARLTRSGRLGLLGSPVFHLGLLVVVVAGLLRLLFFADAGARLLEGDQLAPGPSAWEGQRGGPLAGPFALPRALRLDELRLSLYDTGELQQIAARVTLLRPPADEARDIAINAPLELGVRSIYLMQGHGLAALFAHRTASGERARVLSLEPVERDLRGGLRLEDGREVRARAPRTAQRPEELELRVSRGPALLLVASVRPGETVSLGPGETLRLEELSFWGTLRGSRDVSRAPFFVGVSIGILGIALLFGLVPVDTGVFVQGDALVVSLKPARFAPLYADRFEALCREWTA